MRSAIVAALLALVSLTAGAEREQTLGDFSREIRQKVSSKVTEALSMRGAGAEIAGTVTFSSEDRFFIQREMDGLKVVCDALASVPSVGDEVVVTGTPSLEGGHVVFLARDCRKLSRGIMPEARKIDAKALVAPDAGSGGVNGIRVEISGRTMGVTETGFAITVDNVPVNVLVEPMPDFINDCERTNPKVKIVGVVEQLLDESSLYGRPGYVMGVKLNVSSPDDIVLVPDFDYYAAKHQIVFRRVMIALSVGLGLLLFVFAAVFLRQQRRLLRSRAIMAERKRMADDIHDTIEQHLVGAGMLVRLGKLKEAQDVLSRAKREVRDVVWGLKNDDMMRLSPAEMLRQIAHDETVKGLCRIDTRLGQGLPAVLDAAKMRDLSLMVREAIGNAIKHGGAKKIAMSSDALPGGGWLLRIANDGTVFNPQTAPGPKEGHFGLEGMRQRGRRLGADVTFSEKSGWTVVGISVKGRG